MPNEPHGQGFRPHGLNDLMTHLTTVTLQSMQSTRAFAGRWKKSFQELSSHHENGASM
jgi:hypothetical protein